MFRRDISKSPLTHLQLTHPLSFFALALESNSASLIILLRNVPCFLEEIMNNNFCKLFYNCSVESSSDILCVWRFHRLKRFELQTQFLL